MEECQVELQAHVPALWRALNRGRRFEGTRFRAYVRSVLTRISPGRSILDGTKAYPARGPEASRVGCKAAAL
jgi:hypothetical protein